MPMRNTENPDLQVMCRSGFLSFREICRCSVGMKLKHHGEAVGGIWSARLEGFPCQFLLTEGGRKLLLELGTHQLLQMRRGGFGTSIDGECGFCAGACIASQREREVGVGEIAYGESIGILDDSLHMTNRDLLLLQFCGKSIHQLMEECVPISRFGSSDAKCGIEPTQDGFTMRIFVVIDGEETFAYALMLLKCVEPFGNACTRLSTDGEHTGGWILLLQLLEQVLMLGVGERIGLGEQKQVAFFHLLAEDVGCIGMQTAIASFEDRRQTLWVGKHGERHELQLVSKETLDRLEDGGREVGTGTDRFCKNHIGVHLTDELMDGIHETVEIATKTTAIHFSDLQALVLKQGAINKFWRLVVGNQRDFLALLDELLGCVPQKGGLSRTEESTYDD